ncbi:AAA family ATPase [Nucisporomicrobium flavum]|uniref:cytidylate kinase-like family protein n=1 Tax=Nucisporomicrobium flavum TaxID=2785915 RepID=UPI0018F57B3D|nr:cytidylate kinase-like family protein [Nucisporomicrobium flavum]
MSPPVVTIFESYGSGAQDVGPRVAAALGVTFHAQAFSSEELEGLPKPDDDGLLSRVFSAMGGSYAALEGPAVAMAQRDDHELVLSNTRWVLEAARAGAVIVGRNGALILASWPGALHVRLDAPVDDRVARAARTGGISPERAAKRQRREDTVRADMSIRLYGWDPREPTRYDLVLNTATLDPDACADIIVGASRVKSSRTAPAT